MESIFTTSVLIEVNCNDFWDTPDHVNARFCREHCRATGSEGSLFLMDGKNYPDKIIQAEQFGCTPEFVNAYHTAVNGLSADLVLMIHDV